MAPLPAPRARSSVSAGQLRFLFSSARAFQVLVPSTGSSLIWKNHFFVIAVVPEPSARTTRVIGVSPAHPAGLSLSLSSLISLHFVILWAKISSTVLSFSARRVVSFFALLETEVQPVGR